MITTSRQCAFLALKAVHRGAYANVALDRVLKKTLSDADRRLVTELVYGCTRQARSLDALIDQLAQKPASQQPPDLRTILHLGLYQLRYLQQIPVSAAVNTTVDLVKRNHMGGLSGFVNGLLRHYARLQSQGDPLQLPQDPVSRLGILHSYPDWIIEVWLDPLGASATEQLCRYFNYPPALDLRVNPLRADFKTVQTQLESVGILSEPLPPLPQTLRLQGNTGPIQALPGFNQGWWTVQDASAQLVSHFVDPQPGSTVIDLCAAPGGKAIHLAELMQGQGMVWACDRNAARLRKLQQTLKRLHLDIVKPVTGDSRQLATQLPVADYVLVDAPCSGLGTLHRHADARWRQTPAKVKELARLQSELLAAAAQLLQPSGTLVYATCTLHPSENEAVVQQFLTQHPHWQLTPPLSESIVSAFAEPEGWVKIWPHQRAMDGFFMARFRRNTKA